MAVLPILIHPDPVLRAVCAPVAVFDDALRTLVTDMFATMYAAPGRGLAAPQVGRGMRLFIMDADWKSGPPAPRVFVNPGVVWQSPQRVTGAEGCLSIPGETSHVPRADAVELRWQDLDGAWHSGRFAGFEAVCIQHEADHLDGILCIDRAVPAPETAA